MIKPGRDLTPPLINLEPKQAPRITSFSNVRFYLNSSLLCLLDLFLPLVHEAWDKG